MSIEKKLIQKSSTEFLRKSSKINIIAFLTILIGWFLFIFYLFVSQGGIQEFLTAIAVIFIGCSTIIFWLIRNKLKKLVKDWNIRPKKKFVIIGSIGAIYVETIFWIVGRLSGYIGLAAHPNLIIDLIITMPWYIAMECLLWNVETKKKYYYLEILILGGIYDFFTDGIIGSIFNLNFSIWILIQLIIIYPIFLITYSFIVLPPSFLLEDEIEEIIKEKEYDIEINKWILGLYPLAGLIILLIELIIVLIFFADPIFGIIVIIISVVIIAFLIFRKLI